MAAYRSCDDECVCMDWELHQWDAEGHTLADLDANELLQIALDATGHPGGGQLIVMAAAREAAAEVEDPKSAETILDCLASVEAADCEDNDLLAYASAVQACLPASVTLQSFQID